MIRKTPIIVAGHIVALLISLLIVWFSGENPRVLLYAYAIHLFLFLVFVWFFSINVEVNQVKTGLIARLSRDPGPQDRSRPYYKNDKNNSSHNNVMTREPAGIADYLVGVVTLWFMLGILQFMASGKAFMHVDVLLPELLWAGVVVIVYIITDLFQQRIIIDKEASVPVNLGYNASGVTMLFVAIFLACFAFLVLVFITSMLMGDQGVWKTGFYIEWVTFGALALVRMGMDIARDLKEKQGSFRRMSYRARNR